MNLIKSAKVDPKAFGKLYEKYSERVLKYIYYRVPTIEEAEDLFGQAWENIFNGIRRLEASEELQFQKWMFMLVRNLITDKYRSTKGVCALLDEDLVDSNLNIEEDCAAKEEHEFLHKMMENLPMQQREILVLHFFSDLKVKEIAELLQISENTVSQNLSRGLKKLRIWLSNY
jgi:RNA polymerase sigma-70 factor (ECF subfamily)